MPRLSGSRKPQAGFTLVNIIVLLALMAGAFAGWRIHERRKERAAALSSLEATADRLRDVIRQQLNNDLAWKHTREARENSRMACLIDHSSCEGKGGLIALKESGGRTVLDSTLPTNGFTDTGVNCPSFSDAGSDECPFRYEVVWEPRCTGDCKNPSVSNLTATLRYRPGPATALPFSASPYSFTVSRDTIPSEPRSCAAAYAAGRQDSSTITIRPVPGGPPVYVFCDQTTDGGGWALVANASQEGRLDFPQEGLVTPESHGHYAPERISVLLAASEHQNENNLRLILPDIDGGLRLFASANGSVEAASFLAKMPPGECKKLPDAPIFAEQVYNGEFSLSFKGPGEIAFSAKQVPGKPTTGFSACFGTRPDGTDCGVGCKSIWRGAVKHLRGSIWIK